MPKTNNPRIHWLWWLLGFAMLLAWQYWPLAPSRSPDSPATNIPAPGRAPASVASSDPSRPADEPDRNLPDFLPAEARTTIALIQKGGPFPHRQDGGVFGNREDQLPRRPGGWYREYTVATPGLSHRGARRIITGGNPPQTWHYTGDHYDSFRAFNPGTARGALR